MRGKDRHRFRPATLGTARALRHAQTPAAQGLWARLRAGQLEGYKFRRQHPVGRYVVDSCCASCCLVIEVDGDSHAEQTRYDAARTAWLEEQGYHVTRFLNDDVHHRLQAVLEATLAECQARSGSRSHK